MSETKTQKEVFEALINAGICFGDVVRMNNDQVGVVTIAAEWGVGIEVEDDSFFYLEGKKDEMSVWPTRFCRPMFSQETDTFFLENFLSVDSVTTTVIISYEPVPLTLEERIERLESELKGLRELMCL